MTVVHVVAGILLQGDRMLIAERPVGKPYAGYWEFPGGKIEANESARAALARELHEELGIEVIAARHLFNHTYTYPDKTVSLEVWLVNEFRGEPEGKENQELRRVTFTQMADMRLLEGNWPIVDRLKDFIR